MPLRSVRYAKVVAIAFCQTLRLKSAPGKINVGIGDDGTDRDRRYGWESYTESLHECGHILGARSLRFNFCEIIVDPKDCIPVGTGTDHTP